MFDCVLLCYIVLYGVMLCRILHYYILYIVLCNVLHYIILSKSYHICYIVLFSQELGQRASGFVRLPARARTARVQRRLES